MPRDPQQSGGSDKSKIGFAPEIEVFQLEQFEGIDTRARRSAIKDQEVSWTENFLMIGAANARTMYGQDPPIYTAPANRTIVWAFTFNIGSISYAAVFLDDGTATQVTLVTGAQLQISTMTRQFYNGGFLPHAVQWGAIGILIVSTAENDGYFAWDGTRLFAPGDIAPTWLSGLDGPLTFTGDTTAGNPLIVNVSPNPIDAGVVIGMTATGVGIAPNTTITAGTATTLTVDPAPTANGTTVTLTVNWAMPFGVQGTAIETFLNRVWIINNVLIQTSAPSNGTTFAASNGGIIKSSNDNSLRFRYYALKQANGFLYVLGDSSIYYITNVQSVASGANLTTTYQYTQLDAQEGTSWRDTLQPFGRSLVFANPNGVWAIFGSSATKISDNLDGIFESLDQSVTPSIASATMFAVKTLTLCLRAIDYAGIKRNIIGVFDGKKWVMASQETPPTFIAPQEAASTLATYGTDGTTLYKCFSTPSDTLLKTMQSKLWGGPFGFLGLKKVLRFAMQVEGIATNPVINVFIDSEALQVPVTPQGPRMSALSLQPSLGFINVFLTEGVSPTIFVTNAQGSGYVIGFTLTSLSTDFVLERAALGYRTETSLMT